MSLIWEWHIGVNETCMSGKGNECHGGLLKLLDWVKSSVQHDTNKVNTHIELCNNSLVIISVTVL